MILLPSKAKHSVQNQNTATMQDTLEDVDLILQLSREHLQTLLTGTFWALGVLGFIALMTSFAGLTEGTRTLRDMWVFLPLGLIAGFSSGANYMLKRRNSYDWAANLYIIGLLLGMLSAMALAPAPGASGANVGSARNALPFALTVIASICGLLLPSNRALLLTGLGGGAMLVFLFSYPAEAMLPALGLTAIATVIAATTAGGLYVMAQHSTKSYLMARKRADDFFKNKEELRKALATQDWLNEALTKTNKALEKRAVQLQTSSRVSQQATSILRLDELLPRVVKLIQGRFGYYFVGIWLVDAQEENAVLRASALQGGGDLSQSNLTIFLNSNSMVADVSTTGASQLSNDVELTPNYLPLEELPDTRSVLVLPLHIGEKTVGVLDIQSSASGAFDEEDQMVYQILADQLAIAIRNANLYGAEQQRRHLAESLVLTGRVLSSSLDLSEVPERILEQLSVVVPYKRGTVLIQYGSALHSVAMRGFPTGGNFGDLEVPIREGDVFEQLVKSREPVLIADIIEDARFRQVEGLPLNHSWLGVPLVAKDKVMGMVSLTREPRAAFSQDDGQVVQAFAAQAAIALENASLYAEITRFNEQLEQMVQQRTEELNKAYQTLEKMDKNKSDFINVAAHELRTPLTVIKGYAQILKANNEFKKNPPVYSMLEGILAGTERLHSIVNSMLDVAKIDGQALNMVCCEMTLETTFVQIKELYDDALLERRLTLTLTELETLPAIYADPGLLAKVFDNLVVNAIKYTPDGGQISVSGKTIYIGDTPEMVEIVVADTGIGIALEYQDLIFEKFYQTGEVAVHSSGRTKFKGGGPGLGLAIAKGIIEAHGGRIWVESPGYDEVACPGSKFYVWLPVTENRRHQK